MPWHNIFSLTNEKSYNFCLFNNIICKDNQKDVLVSVDGGINDCTAPACICAGVDVLVAGSFIFKKKPYRSAIQKLKGSIK